MSEQEMILLEVYDGSVTALDVGPLQCESALPGCEEEACAPTHP